MADYWKSNPNWFCPQCQIYIADNKASRDQHTNGLKHKGNVQRAINKINKDARQKIKNQNETAAVMAQINAAVGDTSAPPPPVTSKKPPRPKPSDRFSNYSTAASLGMVDTEWEASVQAAKEAKSSEGSVGQWTSVTPVASSSRSSQLPPDPESLLSATAREEARPTSKTFKEKTLDQDDLWDPALTIKLKKDKNVKVEEASPATSKVEEEGSAFEGAHESKSVFKSRKGFKAAFGKASPSPSTATEVPEVKREEAEDVNEEVPDKVSLDTVDAQPSPDPAPAPTMFKKRKGGANSSGGGAAAQRRKLD